MKTLNEFLDEIVKTIDSPDGYERTWNIEEHLCQATKIIREMKGFVEFACDTASKDGVSSTYINNWLGWRREIMKTNVFNIINGEE